MADLTAPIGVLNVYATLKDLKSRLSISDNNQDPMLWHLLDVASRIVEGQCSRNFCVTSGSKRFNVRDRRAVQVDDLIEVAQVVEDWDGDGIYERIRERKDYLLYPLDSNPSTPHGAPFHMLRKPRRRAGRHFPIGLGTVQITGRWGYRAHFVPLDSYISNKGAQLTKASKSVRVDEAANIRAGQTILVGKEQMFVKQVGASVLNVERGINGTSAANHNDGSALKALSYPAEIIEATLLLAIHRWRHRDGITRSKKPTSGQHEQPHDITPDITHLLAPYRKLTI